MDVSTTVEFLSTIIEIMFGIFLLYIVVAFMRRSTVVDTEPIEPEKDIPTIGLEEVPSGDQIIYLIRNIASNEFLGQGNSIPEVEKILIKKFAGKQFYFMSADRSEIDLVNVRQQ